MIVRSVRPAVLITVAVTLVSASASFGTNPIRFTGSVRRVAPRRGITPISGVMRGQVQTELRARAAASTEPGQAVAHLAYTADSTRSERAFFANALTRFIRVAGSCPGRAPPLA
jgi:hypothetical protein